MAVGGRAAVDRASSMRMSAADFAAALAPLFEGAPRFLTRLAIRAAVRRPMPISGPGAGDRPRDARGGPARADQCPSAPRGAAGGASRRSRSASRATTARPPAEAGRVAAELERLNAAYEARFGFRFCVFVNGRSRAALLPVMAAALDADRGAEIRRALGEVDRDRRRPGADCLSAPMSARNDPEPPRQPGAALADRRGAASRAAPQAATVSLATSGVWLEVSRPLVRRRGLARPARLRRSRSAATAAS